MAMRTSHAAKPPAARLRLRLNTHLLLMSLPWAIVKAKEAEEADEISPRCLTQSVMLLRAQGQVLFPAIFPLQRTSVLRPGVC